MAAGTADRGFDEAGYRARLTAVQAAMADRNMDVIVLTTEHDIRYFSGYFTPFWQSPTRPWFLVVPASGKPVAVIPQIGAECMAQTWLEDIRTWASPHPDDDGVNLLADTITELAGARSTAGARSAAGARPAIGLMKGRETWLRMPLNDFDRLRTRLPGASWPDATAIVQKLRSIKSAAEIGKIRMACDAASTAFSRVPDILQPDMSEVEAFRAFKIACLEAGADDIAFLVGGAAPGGYGDIISPPSDRRLTPGDILILDTGCLWDGYFCDFDRNFSIGEISAQARDAHEIVWAATEAGLEVARPGITCADLFHVMHRAMGGDRNGAGSSVGRLGHGLGMQLTEFPSLTPFDDTVLEAGMVLTLEPGFSFAPGKMMVHEENIVVQDDGAALLTRRAPQTMARIG